MCYIGKRPYKLIEKMKSRAKQLKTDIPAVFIALKRKETPVSAKILAAVTVAYALSPVDLIPDFIPVIGFLDDVLILPGLVALVIRLIPKDSRSAVWRRRTCGMAVSRKSGTTPFPSR